MLYVCTELNLYSLLNGFSFKVNLSFQIIVFNPLQQTEVLRKRHHS